MSASATHVEDRELTEAICAAMVEFSCSWVPTVVGEAASRRRRSEWLNNLSAVRS